MNRGTLSLFSDGCQSSQISCQLVNRGTLSLCSDGCHSRVIWRFNYILTISDWHLINRVESLDLIVVDGARVVPVKHLEGLLHLLISDLYKYKYLA